MAYDIAKDAAKEAVKILTPPKDQEQKSWRRWGWTVVGATIVLNTPSMIHIAWACGWLAFLGFPGFATADSVHDAVSIVEQKLDKTDMKVTVQQASTTSIQIDLLDSKILGTRQAQCEAIKSNNQSAKQFTTDKLRNELLPKYRDLTGTEYQLPDCSEL